MSAVPLGHDHAPDLAEAAADGDLHRLWYTTVPAPNWPAVRANLELQMQKPRD
jgi:hypothetical protein